MTEQELYEKIRSSAEEIEVPESLLPENMKKKLDAMAQQEETKSQDTTEGSSSDNGMNAPKKSSHWRTERKFVAAAAVILVCTAGAGAVLHGISSDGAASTDSMEMASAEDSMETGMATATTDCETAAEEDCSDGVKSDAGELYVVAEGYGEVYDMLKEAEDMRYEALSDMATGTTMDAGESVAMDMAASETTTAVTESGTADSAENSGEGYSTTNLQTEGVDESDIIKTDGSYIYIVDDNVVKVIDIQNTEMTEAGEIKISMDSAADRIVEMYVSGDVLNLIVEREETTLWQESSKEDVYEMDSTQMTELLTYDISDRENPVLKGSTTQDGYYNTSRKIGDIVYLFTENYIEMPDLEREEAVTEEQVEKWIPLVNGSAIAADCIYLPEYGSSALVISSVNVDNPDQIVDNTMIMNDYVNIYVSTEAIYLYGTDYSGNGIKTEIAKFSLKNGIINAVGATSAAGEVYDTFAINEYQGKLRLLTTDWSSGEDENQLYLFDENLKLTGSLEGIAKGEQIYSARYFGDIVYFVTYRNTDPLFAVDLSDEENPKILSALKITGFSEYLHFWGEDKLVGIGYETDPDTGNQEGLKITMFDISDPAHLKVAGSCVIKGIDYSPALYQYKCVLVDEGENLIGFATETYDRGQECNYLLFSWEDGTFETLLTEDLDSNVATDSYRGIYVGDTFYLVNTEEIISYDRRNGYEKVQQLEW